MRGVDAQVGWLLLQECSRVQFCPLLFTLFINDICSSLKYPQHMIFADDTQIYLSCLPSDLDRRIDLIAHDVGVIARFAADTVSSLTLLNPRPSYWAAGPLLVGLIFLSCLVFPLAYRSHNVVQLVLA